MNGLSNEQLVLLNKMKRDGTYRDHRSSYSNRVDYRTSESVLFKIMKKYLEFRNWNLSFKSKYFAKSYFKDCPLSRGEVRAAIRYGNRNGFLIEINGEIGNKSYKLKKIG